MNPSGATLSRAAGQLYDALEYFVEMDNNAAIWASEGYGSDLVIGLDKASAALAAARGES